MEKEPAVHKRHAAQLRDGNPRGCGICGRYGVPLGAAVFAAQDVLAPVGASEKTVSGPGSGACM